MDTAASARVTDSPSVYRAALGSVAVVVPALAIAFRLAQPEGSDPTGQRFVIGIVGAGLLWASLRDGPVRTHLARVTQAYLLAVGAWVVYWAAESGFQGPDLASLVIFQFGLIVVFPRLRQLIQNMVVWLALIALAYAFVAPSSLVHPAFLVALPLALATVGAIAVGERERLLNQLRSDQLLLEARVAERTAELAAASEAKSSFLTRMSHEMRTPINAIIGYTELVREEMEDDELGQDLDRVLEASAQLLRLVDDVLDVRRVEAGELDVRRTETTSAVLVERATKSAQTALAAAGCTLTVEQPDPIGFVTDVDHASHVLSALLDNAARFAPGTQVTLRVARSEEGVRFEVADRGPGIPEAALDRIFEAFVQADESTVRRVDGAGLGLTVARELASALGGTLQAHNDQGAVFRLTLPA